MDGVSFLARDEGDKSHEYTAHLMESVASTWPLFITALLMAFAAGCAIWIFVSSLKLVVSVGTSIRH